MQLNKLHGHEQKRENRPSRSGGDRCTMEKVLSSLQTYGRTNIKLKFSSSSGRSKQYRYGVFTEQTLLFSIFGTLTKPGSKTLNLKHVFSMNNLIVLVKLRRSIGFQKYLYVSINPVGIHNSRDEQKRKSRFQNLLHLCSKHTQFKGPNQMQNNDVLRMVYIGFLVCSVPYILVNLICPQLIKY